MSLDQIPVAVKMSADITSVGIAVGTLAQVLPHVAALLTIVWTLIRIWETETVQRLLGRQAKPSADDE